MSVTFGDLGVPQKIVDALLRSGIEHPFEVQVATIPDALAGRDVLGRAPTGSGKTLAFGIPMLATLGSGTPRRPRGLILSPTRELAEQIRRELVPIADATGHTMKAIYGGVGFGAQLTALRGGVDVLVACPGRLLDLIDQGEVSLDKVNHVIVDESDRMCDMGFLPSLRRILDLTSAKRQTVLFSATLDKDVKVITDQYQTDPVLHEVGDAEPDMTSMVHHFVNVEHTGKIELAADVVAATGHTIVFCRTRHGVDRVARQLKRAGIKSGWIHGGRSQSQRDRALEAFTSQKVLALVATDVAARGIHVDDVACVIHFDPPTDGKTYTHRSGRTARAGAKGIVVSLVKDEERKGSRSIQREAGIECPLESLDEFRVHFPERDPAEWPTIKTPGRQRTKRGGRGGQGPGPKGRSGRNQSSKGRKQGSKGRSSKGRDDQGGADPTGSGRRSKPKKKAGGETRDRSWDTTSSKPGSPKSKSSGPKRGSGKKSTKRSGKARPKNKSRQDRRP